MIRLCRLPGPCPRPGSPRMGNFITVKMTGGTSRGPGVDIRVHGARVDAPGWPMLLVPCACGLAATAWLLQRQGRRWSACG